ncbi:MAG: ChbG/HpnK family deacetylase, partial [Burkholderiales bacterium]|nr:ChbG/HpnK family deacetylase [Burkholderiales bacterium]
IDVTHLDTHMGAAVVPELVEIYVRLGHDYRLPILLPRELDSYTGVLKMGEVDAGLYAPIVARLDAAGLPVFDRFRMTPFMAGVDVDAQYRDIIESLPRGATFFGIHCNAPGDIEHIVPPRAYFRTDEYRLFGSGAPMRWAAEAGIRTIGMREVRDLWRGVRAG